MKEGMSTKYITIQSISVFNRLRYSLDSNSSGLLLDIIILYLNKSRGDLRSQCEKVNTWSFGFERNYELSLKFSSSASSYIPVYILFSRAAIFSNLFPGIISKLRKFQSGRTIATYFNIPFIQTVTLVWSRFLCVYLIYLA